MKQFFRPIIFGLLGTAALLGFYFTILTLVSGWNFALFQFTKNWYWIISLAVGFGVQVGLFIYLRQRHRQQMTAGVMAVSGGTSGAAMIACCTHYLVNILPIIGISGFAVLVGQYQTELFVGSLIFNLFGIGYMLNKVQPFLRVKLGA